MESRSRTRRQVLVERASPVSDMSKSKTEFLPDPSSIRKAVVGLSSDCKRLDLAVAFIGSEWERLIGNYFGPIRLICWLTHPGTDPDAVRSLMLRKGTQVRQRTGLHTKVYLAPELGAVVGSANLSHSALAERRGLPQCEAAVRVSDELLVKEIGNWFDSSGKTILKRRRFRKPIWKKPRRSARNGPSQ